MMTDRIRRRLLFSLGILAALIIVGYAAFEIRNYLRGPTVVIDSPAPGVAVDDELLAVRGTTQNASFITLNDNPIYIDEAGRFEERLLLSYGYNIMEIVVRDRFGREQRERIEVVYH